MSVDGNQASKSAPASKIVDFSKNLFEVTTPSDIDLDKFKDTMRRDTFAGFRGIVKPEEVSNALKLLEGRFDPQNDSASTGASPAKVMTNFQKFNVGGETKARAIPDYTLFRTFYNPIWEEDIYGMRDVFIRLAQVRNVISGKPLNYATTDIEENGLWTASRLHQYPVGGGFFAEHTDWLVNDIADKAETEFYQLLLIMSEKGKHFTRGGGFVEINEQRVILEDHFQPGDIMVYDGRTSHGVEDIDPHVPLDLKTINGRISAFVTLYKKM